MDRIIIPAERILFISEVPWRHVRGYWRGRLSLFRHYQNLLLKRFGAEFTGQVIEVGCEKHYDNRRFFPNVENYICTNIARDHDAYLDVTAMTDLTGGSQDGFVCVSVLEHISDFQKALDEIDRTLKIGGRLILTVPFIYWRHDSVDYWRFGEDFYADYFPNYEVQALVHLGGRLSAVADLLQKPHAVINKRFFVYKLMGLLFVLLARYFDVMDNFPLGYGFYAIKKA